MWQWEAGGHRWQRIPPTERKGRVHSSTVTVAVMDTAPFEYQLVESDVEMRFTKDTGPGGQHRNKTESCVVMVHKPTGITAKSAERCQHSNRRKAWAVLEQRVAEYYQNTNRTERERTRKLQVGSGQRADKVRTYSLQNDTVTDHRSNDKISYKKVSTGILPQAYTQ